MLDIVTTNLSLDTSETFLENVSFAGHEFRAKVVCVCVCGQRNRLSVEKANEDGRIGYCGYRSRRHRHEG